MIAALDCETSKKPTFKPWQKGAYLATISTYNEEGQSTFTVFHHNEGSEDSWRTDRDKVADIQRYLDSCSCIVGSNLKFDLLWLKLIGVKYEHLQLFDTQVAEYLLNAQSKTGLSLDACAEKYLGEHKLDVVKTEYWEKGIDTADVPLKILEEYNISDCRLSLNVALKQRELLKEKKLLKVFSIEMEKLKLLSDIEYNGMKVDVEELQKQKIDSQEALEICEHNIKNIIGLDFNIESNDQLSVALFGGKFYTDGIEEVEKVLKNGTVKKYTRKCSVPVEFPGFGFTPEKGWEAKKEGFFHTSKDVLAPLKHQCKSKESKELVALLVERSAISQRIKTFLDGLEDRLEDGILHPTMNNTVTVTGRLSCSNPKQLGL